MRRDPELLSLVAWLVAVHVVLAGAAWWLWRHFEPAQPRLIGLLAVITLLAVWAIIRHRKLATEVKLSSLGLLRGGSAGLLVHFRYLPHAASLTGLGLLLLSMTRPQSKDSWQDVTREGIDIMIAMDVSASMLARDFDPDRLQAGKAVALKFIDDRRNDNIGLVIYEGEAFTQCPLTSDHEVLKDLFMQARSGTMQGGTAVGMGLATAVNRLRESQAKSKVVILLTDGVSNAGTVQPLDAAQIAAQFGVRVYTIGVGTRGQAMSPVARYPNGQYRYEMVPVEIDDASLTQVAELTGGKYFRATDKKKLVEIYAEIDRMERTRIKVTEHSRRNEEYFPLVLAGACCLVAASIANRTLLRSAT
jgi:Ca-activated chloride channel family protein